MSTGNPELDLVAHVYRQALKDAERGHRDAVLFLDSTAPEWRQYVTAKPKHARTCQAVQEGQNISEQPEKSNGRLLTQLILPWEPEVLR